MKHFILTSPGTFESLIAMEEFQDATFYGSIRCSFHIFLVFCHFLHFGSVTKDSLALSYVQCTTCFRQVIFILWGLDNTSGCVVEGLEVLTLTWKLLWCTPGMSSCIKIEIAGSSTVSVSVGCPVPEGRSMGKGKPCWAVWVVFMCNQACCWALIIHSTIHN